MLKSENLLNENNIRNPSMTEISQEDFENVSLFAHHIGLKVLFGVLANHDSALAADIAMELNRAQTALPQIMKENLHPYVNKQLQEWIDLLNDKDQPNG